MVTVLRSPKGELCLGFGFGENGGGYRFLRMRGGFTKNVYSCFGKKSFGVNGLWRFVYTFVYLPKMTTLGKSKT
jgi:hypothetical protein